jgi:sialic acid synthase SpsE
MKRFKIGDRWLGEGEPCYIVAEAGSNHNGSYEQALRLIDVAVEARADAVKFQTFKAARMYPRSAGTSDYLNTPKAIYDIIEDMEMPDEWVPRLAGYCRERGIAFLSSALDEGSADLLDPYVPAFKVASYEMTHLPLLRHIARKRKPIIMSTGTATLEEVVRSVEAIVDEGSGQIVVLQCTARYPAPLQAVNARAMLTIREAIGRPVGLSDHSRDAIVAPAAATALGASLIEKHFTLSNRLPGPDHLFAVEPDELVRLVHTVRAVEEALGHGRKETLPEERELHAFARRSVFATRNIQAGEVITADNIAVLRRGKVGYGLIPDEYDNLLGRVAARHIPAETLIRWADVER